MMARIYCPEAEAELFPAIELNQAKPAASNGGLVVYQT